MHQHGGKTSLLRLAFSLLGVLACAAGCSKGGAGPNSPDDLGMGDPGRDGGRLDLAASADLALPPAEGKPVWGRSYKNPGNNVGGVAVGPDGAVYLTGSFAVTDFGDGEVTAQGALDCFLLKFDKNGQRLWARTFGRGLTDWPSSIAVDRAGNAVLTGVSTSSTTGRGDAFVAYYESSGAQRYFKQFGIPSASSKQTPAIAAGFGIDGSVYFTGAFEDRINFGGGELVAVGGMDIYLVQLSAAGTLVFAKSWGNYNTDVARALSMTPDGDVLLTGTGIGAIDFGDGSKGTPVESSFLVRLSTQGVGRWSKRWALDANTLLVKSAPDDTVWVGLDLNDHAVDLGGGPRSAPTGHGLMTAHFTGAGAYLDSFLLSSSASSYYTALAVDGTGQVLAGGVIDGDIDFGFGPTTNSSGKAFFLKQSSRGQVRWVQRLSATENVNIEGVAASPDNSVLIGGSIDGNVKLGTVSLTPHTFVLSLTP